MAHVGQEDTFRLIGHFGLFFCYCSQFSRSMHRSAHEGYQRHLLREQLQQDGIAQPGNRRRDRHSGQVVCETTPLFRPDEEVEVRLNRICSAVQAKEENYHTGTDTLLVLEQPAAYLREHNLHARVVNVLHERSSNYERIYVIYGSVVQQVK